MTRDRKMRYTDFSSMGVAMDFLTKLFLKCVITTESHLLETKFIQQIQKFT
jgi:hypothetical protein